MDCEEVVRQLRELADALGSQIICAYLFGSVSRGEATDGSDTDVAILLPRSPAGRLTDLRFELERLIEQKTGRPAQVVVLNDAPPDLVQRVLRDGRLIVDRDRASRLNFEVRARNLYFDLLPTLNLYRRRGAPPS